MVPGLYTALKWCRAPQNARHRIAAKASPGQKAQTAKLKLLEPKKSGEEWVVEGQGEGQEDDDSWAAQLAKNRRSRFAKTNRDELSVEKNSRNNVVFKGVASALNLGVVHTPVSTFYICKHGAWIASTAEAAL